jgi:hypothetical protein
MSADNRNPLDPPEPDSVDPSPLRIIRNAAFVYLGLIFYLLGAAWGLGWLR